MTKYLDKHDINGYQTAYREERKRALYDLETDFEILHDSDHPSLEEKVELLLNGLELIKEILLQDEENERWGPMEE